MFQQRPRSGWGTPRQIRDPQLSTRAFFGVATHTDNRGLVDIAGWQQMTVTEAAQAVQVSGFPTAYAKWEPAARSIVQQLGDGVTPGPNSEPLVCGTGRDAAMGGDCSPSGSPAEKGLTRDALLALRCVHGRFPQITTFGGVRADSLPDHPSGRAVDFMIDNYQTAAGNAYGWQVARWLKDHRSRAGRLVCDLRRQDLVGRPRPRRVAGLPTRLHLAGQRFVDAPQPCARHRVRRPGHRLPRSARHAAGGVDDAAGRRQLPGGLRVRLLLRARRAGLPRPVRHPGLGYHDRRGHPLGRAAGPQRCLCQLRQPDRDQDRRRHGVLPRPSSAADRQAR